MRALIALFICVQAILTPHGCTVILYPAVELFLAFVILFALVHDKLVSINEKSWDIKNVVFIEEGGIIHAVQVVDNDLRPLAIGSDKTIDSDAIQTTKLPLVHHKPFFSSLSLIVVHALCRCDFN